MKDRAVGAILIVDDGVLTGLCSERDILRRVVAGGADPRTTRIGDVATYPVVTVAPETPIKHCVELFRRNGFRHLPVVDGKKPVGIIGLRDLLTHVSDILERIVDNEAYRQAVSSGGDPYDHFGGSYAR
jgi:CBS domain-containing protein